MSVFVLFGFGLRGFLFGLFCWFGRHVQVFLIRVWSDIVKGLFVVVIVSRYHLL